LAGIVSILCKVVRDCLYDPKFTLYILLSGTKDFAVVLIWNLTRVQRQVQKTGTRRTLANGCSKIKRPSRLGLLVAVAMDSEKRGECLRDSDELVD
jgi:hypothetical protein